MAKVEQKQPIIKEISDYLNGASAAVLVNYRGLTVEQDTVLRKQLRESGIIYKVYKNTMINFAVKDTEFADLAPLLEGPTAIAISKDDATAPARIIAQFAKTAPLLEMKAGVVEGTFYDAAGINAIAEIPSRDVLLGRLFGSMQSPIANLARVLKKKKKKGGAGAAEEPKAEEAPQEAAVEEAAPQEEVKAEEGAAEAPAAE